MIKKALLIPLFLLLSASYIFASITFSENIIEEDRIMLSRFISNGVSSRRDADITISAFERNDSYLRLYMSVEGKEMSISAHDEEELEDFIINALSLEESLFLDGSTLYYVSDNIVASHDEHRKGELYDAKDITGRRRALLEVIDTMDGIALYSPIYQKDLVAGLTLEKGPSFSLSLRALSNIAFNNFAFALDFAYLPLFAYFNPLLSFYVSYNGSLSYYGGIGFEARLPLERLLNTHFTLIEEGAIFASAMLYLGYNGSFDFASGFSVGYEHFISSRIKWRVGWESSTINSGAIMLALGVLF